MPPAFNSPLPSLSSWTLSIADVVIPAGFRYSGLSFPALRATAATAAAVNSPTLCSGAFQAVSGVTWFEGQTIPFPNRAEIAMLPFGVPTFYLAFDSVSVPPLLDPPRDCAVQADAFLTSTTGVSIVLVGQDRTARHPMLWASQISAAIASVMGNASSWAPFDTAIAAAFGGRFAPLMLLDARGQPLASGNFDLVGADQTVSIALSPPDGGDATAAVRRLNAAGTIALGSPWDLAAPINVRPTLADGSSSQTWQVAGVEDGASAPQLLQVTSSRRHLMVTNLVDWFAPQVGAQSDGTIPMAPFTRGNRLKTYVNGHEYFDDWLRLLHAATGPGNGLHLSGWDCWPTDTFTTRLATDPADQPLTLEQAVTLIGASGGTSAVLLARFYQLESSDPGEQALTLVLMALLATVWLLEAYHVDAARTNTAGIFITALAWIAAVIALEVVVQGNGALIETNAGALTTLNAVANTHCALASHPALQVDNPLQQTLPTLGLIRHWGIYHQKLSIVKTPAGHSGFCGGIDVNPNRLDDANHLVFSPFHDVHARFEGPAVADLALTFEQRWLIEGTAAADHAFPVPAATALAAEIATDTTPRTAIQVARTYFAPNPAVPAPARAYSFATMGDATLHDSIIAGINAAREFIYIEDQYLTPPLDYQAALVAAVPRVKKLIITVPGITDQPFGEVQRSGLVSALQAADTTGKVVRVGYPRRHATMQDAPIRIESGRLLLGQGGLDAGTGGFGMVTAVLGPKSRLPAPPFWIVCEGEVMWVYESAPLPTGVDNTKWQAFHVDRGDATHLSSGTTGGNPSPRAHAEGAPVSVIDFTNIYVHAKLMIVDDVFLSLGSANLNRRGLFHDAECNIFAVPESLRTSMSNPVAALRRRLWAEALHLPEAMAEPLLLDPVASAALFARPPLLGNRHTEISARPTHLLWDLSSSDGIVSEIADVAMFTLGALAEGAVYDTAVDPTSFLDPMPT